MSFEILNLCICGSDLCLVQLRFLANDYIASQALNQTIGIATAKLICNNCTLNFYLSNLIENSSIWRNWFIDCPTKNCVSWSFFEVGSFDVRHVWHIILGGSQKLEKLPPHFAVFVQQ